MALKLNHNKAILYFEHVGEVREKINHFTRYYFHNKASNSSYCLLYLLILSRHLQVNNKYTTLCIHVKKIKKQI
jgi:hypothetical protein